MLGINQMAYKAVRTSAAALISELFKGLVNKLDMGGIRGTLISSAGALLNPFAALLCTLLDQVRACRCHVWSVSAMISQILQALSFGSKRYAHTDTTRTCFFQQLQKIGGQ